MPRWVRIGQGVFGVFPASGILKVNGCHHIRTSSYRTTHQLEIEGDNWSLVQVWSSRYWSTKRRNGVTESKFAVGWISHVLYHMSSRFRLYTLSCKQSSRGAKQASTNTWTLWSVYMFHPFFYNFSFSRTNEISSLT